MNSEKDEVYAESIAILIGAVIGAGILGLPAVLDRNGLCVYVVITIIAFWIYYVTALATKRLMLYFRDVDRVYLGDIVELSFGKVGKYIVIGSLLFSFIPTLAAYFTAYFSLFTYLRIRGIYGVSLLFLICLFPMLVGLERTGKFELTITSLMLTTVLLIVVFLFPECNLKNVHFLPPPVTGTGMVNIMNAFLVMLFAMGAYMVVPETYKLLRHEHMTGKFRKVVAAGFGIPAIIYLLFSVAVVASMPGVNEIAPTSFNTFPLKVLGVNFALFAVATSAIAVTLAATDMMASDLGLNRLSAIPLLFIGAFMGLKRLSFIELLAIAACYGMLVPIAMILLTVIKKEVKIKKREKMQYLLCLFVVIAAMLLKTLTLLS